MRVRASTVRGEHWRLCPTHIRDGALQRFPADDKLLGRDLCAIHQRLLTAPQRASHATHRQRPGESPLGSFEEIRQIGGSTLNERLSDGASTHSHQLHAPRHRQHARVDTAAPKESALRPRRVLCPRRVHAHGAAAPMGNDLTVCSYGRTHDDTVSHKELPPLDVRACPPARGR